MRSFRAISTRLSTGGTRQRFGGAAFQYDTTFPLVTQLLRNFPQGDLACAQNYGTKTGETDIKKPPWTMPGIIKNFSRVGQGVHRGRVNSDLIAFIGCPPLSNFDCLVTPLRMRIFCTKKRSLVIRLCAVYSRECRALLVRPAPLYLNVYHMERLIFMGTVSSVQHLFKYPITL